jgi:hypothetical protein
VIFDHLFGRDQSPKTHRREEAVVGSPDGGSPGRRFQSVGHEGRVVSEHVGGGARIRPVECGDVSLDDGVRRRR